MSGRYLLLLLIVACACDAPGSQVAAHDAGHVVRNERRNGWDRSGAWQLVPLTRIGAEGESGPAVAVFGQVVDVAIDEEGRVWVADGVAQEIKVFRADGSYIRSVGRKGHGPAEFTAIAGMDWGPGGNLWVLDGGNARFAVYDTAGRLLQTRPRDLATTMSPWPGGFDRAGRLVDLGAITRTADSRSLSLVRFSADWSSVDTLDLPAVREASFGSLSSTDGTNERVRTAPVPFMPRQIWAVDPEGYAWIANGDAYRIQRTAFDGAVHRVIELDNEPPKVTRDEKDAILRNYAWFEAEGGKLDRSLIPDEHPDLLGFFVDDESHLWVTPAYPQRENPPFDVFDSTGTYLGQLRTPVRILAMPSPVIRNGVMAAVSRDTDGVDSVVLLRLLKAHP